MDIILLHGWGGSAKSLAGVGIQLNNAGYKVHILEMPGHGDTPEMTSPWGMEDYANWLKQKVAELSPKNYALVGHSFGGKIILEAVTSGIVDPKAIVLIDSNGIKPHGSLRLYAWLILSKIFRLFSALPFYKNIRFFVYRHLIGEVDYVNANNNLRESFKIFNKQHYDEKINSIDVPTLIVWGRSDKVTPIWMGEVLHRGIKGSKLEVYEGTHGLPLKNPDIVAKCIINFLQTNDPMTKG